MTKGVPGKVLKKGTLDKGRAWEGFGEKGTARHGTHGKGRAWEGFGEGHSTARMEKGALGEGFGKGTQGKSMIEEGLGKSKGTQTTLWFLCLVQNRGGNQIHHSC